MMINLCNVECAKIVHWRSPWWLQAPSSIFFHHVSCHPLLQQGELKIILATVVLLAWKGVVFSDKYRWWLYLLVNISIYHFAVTSFVVCVPLELGCWMLAPRGGYFIVPLIGWKWEDMSGSPLGAVSNMTTYTTMQQRGESNISQIFYIYLLHSKDLVICIKVSFEAVISLPRSFLFPGNFDVCSILFISGSFIPSWGLDIA